MDDIIEQEERRLKKLRQRLNTLRPACHNLRRNRVKSLAEAFGRKEDTSRGKEHMFISEIFPSARPLSIPDHSGGLYWTTALSILDQLEEEDLFLLEQRLEEMKDRRQKK